MLNESPAFSGFSVRDLTEATQFYGELLGITIEEVSGMHTVMLHLTHGGQILLYQKDDHVPATFTVLNFPVTNIDTTVDALVAKGISFEKYENMSYQDEKGIARGIAAHRGPDIAWFLDPSGNILSVLQNE